MGTDKNTAKKDGNSSFLNLLLNSQRLPQSKKEKKNTTKSPKDGNAARSIKSFLLTPSTSSQNEQNESLYSVSSFGSTVVDMGVMPELAEMVSNLESRKKSLEEKKAKISEIGDVQIKNVLLDIISDVTQCVEDSDKILMCQNALICRYNEDSNVLIANSRSINNLTKGVGSLVDSQNELKDRVQSLEITKDCALDSHLLNIILVDQKEADEIENGSVGPKQKFARIMSDMKITSPKEIVDAKLITTRKFISGNRKMIKILKIRFGDPVTPSRIFAQIVKHNNELSKAGQQANVKYYVETPTSKNVWALKRICYELKNDGVFHSVRGCERGILVSYKIKDPQDENKITFRSSVMTSEKDVDELRVSLNVDDAYIPVNEKYNAEYWNNKKKPETTKKRARETNEIDLTKNGKKLKIPSSTPKRD